MNAAPAAQAIEQAQNAATASHDPLVIGIVFVASVVVGLVAIAKPIMGLYREYKKTGAEGAKAEAESSLFTTLQGQIESNSKAIEKLQIERNVWFEKATLLDKEVARLTSFEANFNSMKERLNEKDRIIESRETEIRSLTRSVLDMKDRIHALEMRLVKDEQKFCDGCRYKEPQNNGIKISPEQSQ